MLERTENKAETIGSLNEESRDVGELWLGEVKPDATRI